MSEKRTLIDREIFFGNPEITGGIISPNGDWIAFMKEYEGIMNIYVKAINEPFENAIVLTKSKSPIMGYTWTEDGKHILFVNDNQGDENFNLYSVDPHNVLNEEHIESFNLTPMKDVNVQIQKVSRKDPNLVWVSINDRDKAWHDLYKLEISTRKLSMIYENHERITGWEFDWDENIRLAYRTDENGLSEILRVGAGFTDMQLIYKTNLKENAFIQGWNADSTKAYLVSNKGDVDLSTLYEFDVDNISLRFLEDDPEGEVDFGGLSIDRNTREILGSSYVGDRVRRYWQNDAWKQMFDGLTGRFEGREISIANSTKDYQKLLISVDGDRSAGEVWLYDRVGDNLSFQYTVRPKLKEVEDGLSPMTSISYKSSDGLEIKGYLTLPISAKSAKNLPCVILVHGGPKGPRDHWGYDGEVQFLANRGYAVLQPNFRASGGFGKAFLNAGDGEWGRLMQDDITWGAKYLIEKGIANSKKIAIMGGSYGGYATLAGLAFTPEVFACGVDIVGPSNLFTLLESIPAYWEAGRQWLYEMTGDPNTEEGKELLTKSSPLFSADKIVKPLLIVQGANDPRVKKAEADQIVEALKTNGQAYTYLLAEDEGHGFRKPLNRMAMHVEVERFFAEHLGGEFQEEVGEEVGAVLDRMRV